jgi:hypothetical protein
MKHASYLNGDSGTSIRDNLERGLLQDVNRDGVRNGITFDGARDYGVAFERGNSDGT